MKEKKNRDIDWIRAPLVLGSLFACMMMQQ